MYVQDFFLSTDFLTDTFVSFIILLSFLSKGRVRVVRMQKVIDVQNESKFATQKTEELGYGKSFSHADGK